MAQGNLKPVLAQSFQRILENTYSLRWSSFLGLLFGILNIEMVIKEKGTTMETIGGERILGLSPSATSSPWRLCVRFIRVWTTSSHSAHRESA